MKKRVVALFLTVCMVVSVLASSVTANEVDSSQLDETSTTENSEIDNDSENESEESEEINEIVDSEEEENSENVENSEENAEPEENAQDSVPEEETNPTEAVETEDEETTENDVSEEGSKDQEIITESEDSNAQNYDATYSYVKIDSTSFPDANFRAFIKGVYDTNGDGYLSSTELNVSTFSTESSDGDWTMEGKYGPVYSMKGIEYFNFKYLKIRAKNIKELDLTNNNNLLEVQFLSCYKLGYIGIPNNSQIYSFVFVGGDSLYNLNFNIFPNLKYLVLMDCPNIISLDISSNKYLTHLRVEKTNLSSIDISQNSHLIEAYNKRITCSTEHILMCDSSIKVNTNSSYSIAKKSYSITSTMFYDGKQKYPTVSIGGLTNGVDYSLYIYKNINIGTGTVIAVGKGNYSGTLRMNFNIVAKVGSDVSIGSFKYRITSQDTVTLLSTTKKSGAIVVPATITYGGHTFKVTRIGDNAFKNKTKITSVEIGENVESIGKYAFMGCSYLNSVKMNSKMKTIERSAFSKCVRLKSISLPSTVTTIGDYAFYNCKAMSSVSLGYGLKTIGMGAFQYCKAIRIISIPNSCTTIGKKAFFDCSSLTNVHNSTNLTSLGVSAFSKCVKLQYIVLPNTLKVINDYTFYNCKSLTSITIPSSVTTIKKGAFQYCKGLTSLKTTSVSSIGTKAFYGCSSLKSIDLGEGLRSIGSYAFRECKKLKTITIRSEGLDSIGKYAFNKSISGRKFILPPEDTVAGYYYYLIKKSIGVKIKYTQWDPCY